jgi:hypothetical protein
MKQLITMILLFVLAYTTQAADVTDAIGTTTTWTKAESPYNLTTDVIVPIGGSLTLEPGVKITMNGHRIICNGTLTAIGTVTDSIMITGGGIDLVNSGVHRLRYVQISNSEDGGGLLCIGAVAWLQNCVITQNHNSGSNYITMPGAPYSQGGGVAVYGKGSVTLDSCQITHNSSVYNTSAMGGQVYAGGQGGGIYLESGSRAVLRSCDVTRNSTNSSGSAMSAVGAHFQAMDCLFAWNSTANNTSAINDPQPYLGETIKGGGSTLSDIVNCTITGNTVSGNSPTPVGGVSGSSLTNSIVWGNTGIQVRNLEATWSDIGPADSAVTGDGNIYSSPIFADSANGDLSLAVGSPCIDTGDATSPTDRDGSRADIGMRDFDIVMPQLDAIPSLQVSEAEPKQLVLANNGTTPVTVQSIVLTDNFTTTMAFPQEILAGDTLTVPITYSRSDASTGTATITSTDPHRPEVTTTLNGIVSTSVPNIVTTRTWTADHGPYLVDVPVLVPFGDTLTIGPGVTVIQKPGAALTVQGAIHANGTEESNVVFHADSASTRAPIILDGTDSCWFNWTTIRDGLSPKGSGVRVTRTANVSSFTNCSFIGNVAHEYVQSPHSYSWRGTGGAIMLSATVRTYMTNCLFRGNGAVDGAAVWIQSGATMFASRSVYTRNFSKQRYDWDYGVQHLGVICVANDSRLEMDHCSFAANSVGYFESDNNYVLLDLYVNGTASITNTAFTPRVLDDILNHYRPLFATSHDVVQGAYNCAPVGLIDDNSTTNIVAYPLFSDTDAGDFSLTWGSLCIDAGDLSLTDPDGTRSDIGAYYFPHGVGVESTTPAVFALSQNAPNPFNPVTTIPFSLKTVGDATLSIYNVQGQLVKTLVSGHHTVGQHTAVWNGTTVNGRQVASGVYFYRLVTDQGTRVRRMTLVR